MPVVLVYALLAVAPSVALVAAARALERWCGSYTAGGRREQSEHESLQRLAASLRRLEDDYRRIAGSDLPARVSRMHTVTLAYDDTLRACCRAVGVPEPRVPLTSLDRLQTEAALAQQGVTW